VVWQRDAEVRIPYPVYETQSRAREKTLLEVIFYHDQLADALCFLEQQEGNIAVIRTSTNITTSKLASG
jgi:hypothetical protein